MTKLKALKSFATAHIAPMEGQEFSCPDDRAKDLIAAGYAQEIAKELKRDESKRADIADDSKPSKRGKRKSDN